MIYKSESIADLSVALLNSQNEFDPVLKDCKNPLYGSKYADLDGVLKATQPTLSKHNLVISQLPISDLANKGVGIHTILIHTLSGQYIGSDFLLPAIGYGKDKSERYDPQTGTGAVTYSRRTAYLGILGISAEDDDGNASSRAPEAPKAVSKPTTPTKQAEVPKAENPFPNSSASATAETAPTAVKTAKSADANNGNSSLPTAEELDGYRKRFGKLVDALSTNGLKSSKGLPLQKKVLAYLLQQTGAPAAEKVSKDNWENFFSNVSAVTNETGITKVVELINESLNQKESVA